MFAVVSSAIYPSAAPAYGVVGGGRTLATPEQRLEQTRKTIASLLALGTEEILVADASGRRWRPEAQEALSPARVVVVNQYPFRNKGLSELYLLLAVLPELPDDRPLLKISGRYLLERALYTQLGTADIAGKLYARGSRSEQLSTRCYVVRNRPVLEQFLLGMLREVYSYGSRIAGPRSSLAVLRRALLPKLDDYPYEDPPVGIETCAALAVRRLAFRFHQVEALGISGFIAGDPLAAFRE